MMMPRPPASLFVATCLSILLLAKPCVAADHAMYVWTDGMFVDNGMYYGICAHSYFSRFLLCTL